MSVASLLPKGRARLVALSVLVLAVLLAACGAPISPAAPVATPQALETTEDAAVTVTLAGEDPNGGTLVYTVTSEPENGSLSGTAPNLTYTPDANFLGRDTFAFTVASGGRVSSEATVSVEVLSTPFYAITRGTSGVEGPEDDVTSLLYRVDERGRVSLVGDTGHALIAIKVDPTDGTLYATTRSDDVETDACHSCLVTLDAATGAATVVGQFDFDGDPLSTDGSVPSLVFTSDGQLYGYTEHGDDFVVIDKATAAATVPSDTSISSYGHSMWADEEDVLWFINGDGDVFTIDPATGTATPVHDGEDLAAAAGIDYESDFQARGDRDPATGKYWGVSPAYGFAPAGGVIRLAIDADSAEFIDVAKVESIAGIHHIAFVR